MDYPLHKHRLEVTDEEADMLIAALLLVTPSGGGGPENSLAMYIQHQTQREPSGDMPACMWQTVLRERKEAGEPFDGFEVDFAVDILAGSPAGADNTAAFDALIYAARAYRESIGE